MKKALWITSLLSLVPMLSFAQAINANQIDSAALRKFLDSTARDFCVQTYTDPSVGDGSNLKNLTLAGMNVKDVCNCTVKEMQYYVPDDMGRKFVGAISKLSKSGHSEMTGEDELVYKQWNQRFDSAMSVCRNKLGRKK